MVNEGTIFQMNPKLAALRQQSRFGLMLQFQQTADQPWTPQSGLGSPGQLPPCSCANRFPSVQIKPPGFRWSSVDFCSVSSSVSSVTARALLTCEADSEALFQTPPLDSQVVATITLDTVECRIRDTNLEISGEIGVLLSGLTETQQIARDWAQSQLSLLCAMYR